ncbi:hypothetical protein ACLB2K_035270 [Fragaria x ananassa]
MCILAGCDYIPEFEKIAAKTAGKLIKKYKNFTIVTNGRDVKLKLKRRNDIDDTSKLKVLEMCILAGCDYIPEFEKITAKTADKLIKKYKNFTTVTNGRDVKLKLKRRNDIDDTSKLKVAQVFRNAIKAFTYQQVYDPATRTCKRSCDKDLRLSTELFFNFQIMYKFDVPNRRCDHYAINRLRDCEHFKDFTKKQVLEMCILAGCDYIPEIEKIVAKTGSKLIKKYKNFTAVINGRDVKLKLKRRNDIDDTSKLKVA